jgi:hypothetical protein
VSAILIAANTSAVPVRGVGTTVTPVVAAAF